MILFIIGLLVMYFLSNVYFILYNGHQTSDQQNMNPFPGKSEATFIFSSLAGGYKWVVVFVVYFLYLLRDG